VVVYFIRLHSMTTTYFVILTEADQLEVFPTEAVRDAQLCYYYEIEFDCKGYDLTVESYQGLVEEANGYGSELVLHPDDFKPSTVEIGPYPTTVHRCTKTQAWGLACDPANALRVSLRLAELCPDARNWEWLEAEAIHPDTERHVPIAIVIVPSGYTALVNRLSNKLLVRQYDMTMIQREPVAA
jgi:hypothetical protein